MLLIPLVHLPNHSENVQAQLVVLAMIMRGKVIAVLVFLSIISRCQATLAKARLRRTHVPASDWTAASFALPKASSRAVCAAAAELVEEYYFSHYNEDDVREKDTFCICFYCRIRAIAQPRLSR